MKNAVRNGSSWEISTIADGYFYGPLDIGIGPDDTPHVTYHEGHQITVDLPQSGQGLVGRWYEGSVSLPSVLLFLLVEPPKVPEHRRRRRHTPHTLPTPPPLCRPALPPTHSVVLCPP